MINGFLHGDCYKKQVSMTHEYLTGQCLARFSSFIGKGRMNVPAIGLQTLGSGHRRSTPSFNTDKERVV